MFFTTCLVFSTLFFDLIVTYLIEKKEKNQNLKGMKSAKKLKQGNITSCKTLMHRNMINFCYKENLKKNEIKGNLKTF